MAPLLSHKTTGRCSLQGDTATRPQQDIAQGSQQLWRIGLLIGDAGGSRRRWRAAEDGLERARRHVDAVDDDCWPTRLPLEAAAARLVAALRAADARRFGLLDALLAPKSTLRSIAN